MSFGELLRVARIAAGLTQAELARRVNVATLSIHNWESDATQPQAQNRASLLAVLGDFDSGRDEHTTATEDSGTTEDASFIGAWLKQARIESGLSIHELATKSGLSYQAIWYIESGKSLNPQKATRERLEAALNKRIPAEVKYEAEKEQSVPHLGALTDFDPYDVASLPELAGVYVFYDISDRPVYVGKSGNIANRVIGHSEKFWFRPPIVRYAAFLQIDAPELRHQVEQALIKFLKSNAVLNKQGVEHD